MYSLAWVILLASYDYTEASPETAWNVTEDEGQESDIIPTPGSSRSRSISEGTELWGKVVPYFIDPSVPIHRRKLFERAVLQFNKYLPCVRFIEKRPEDTYYVHVVPSQGCTSALGWQGRSGYPVQRLTLANYCHLSGTMHEMMHTLGFMHENQRDDSGKYLIFHNENLQNSWQEGQVSNRLAIKQNWRKYLPYDYSSLMHYFATAFAKPGTKTITTRHSNKSIEDKMGLESGFSSCDVYKMNFVYGCKRYTDRQRERFCRLHTKRAKLVCPMRDENPYCREAALDRMLCITQPGFFQINCPVACDNCEGRCSDNPYERDFCRQAAAKGAHGCRRKEQYTCPVACGIC